MTRRTLGLALAALLAAGTHVTAAHADETTYCVAYASEVSAGGVTPVSPPPVCSGDVVDAIEAATGRRIVPPEEISRIVQTVTQATQTVIGIDYEHPVDQYGNSLTGSNSSLLWLTANSSGCLNGATFAGVLPNSWKNRVSGALSFQGCGVFTHYDNSNFTGGRIPCPCWGWPSGAGLQLLDDRTESVRLCKNSSYSFCF